MFKNLRWRLTLLFVLLTALVYGLAALLGFTLLSTSLTKALDEELEQLVSEAVPLVEVNKDTLTMRPWSTNIHTTPFRVLASIQIFDKNERLVREYGPAGVEKLYKGTFELKTNTSSVRSKSSPLSTDDGLIGFVQVQLPTNNRESARHHYAVTLLSAAPVIVLALGVSGFFFAGVATKPVEESFMVLRSFMTDAGHELSTPVSIVQAAAENLLRESKGAGTVEDRVQIIARATDRMSTLIQDLMLLSKLESNQLPINFIWLDLKELVAAVVDEFQDLYKQKNIELTFLDCHEMPPFYGVNDSLQRLLTNLLSNSLRYTEEGGKVVVDLALQGRSIRLRVTDNGIGIPETSLKRIFDRFYRVDASRARAMGGSGLGLSIAKAITDLHKGRIEVHSKPAEGTIVSIYLPLPAARPLSDTQTAPGSASIS